nr:CPBP family intramembrane glutamic endopeptidase [Anaeromonas frigoriresistens]
MIIISFFGEIKAPPLPTPSTGGSYLIGLLIIAITPGICEEVMFRGFIMKAYGNKGYKKAIFISAILFGIFHFNLQNLLGPIFLGVLFGFMVYRTNSLIAGIIGHATNNAFAWTLTYLVSKLNIPIEQTQEASIEISETMSIVITTIVLLGIAFFTSILAYYLYKKLPNRRVMMLDSENEKDMRNDRESKGIIKYIPIIITVIGFIVLNVLVYI